MQMSGIIITESTNKFSCQAECCAVKNISIMTETSNTSSEETYKCLGSGAFVDYERLSTAENIQSSRKFICAMFCVIIPSEITSKYLI